MAERVPPHDDEAEQSVLGAMMLSADVVGDVADLVAAEDFYTRRHRVIFESLVGQFSRGEPVDQVATAAELKRTGKLEEAGGALVLNDLTLLVPSPASAVHYARIVARTATLRRLIHAAAGVLDLAYANTDPEQAAEKAEGLIYAAARLRDADSAAAVEDLVAAAIDELRSPIPPGTPTGYRDLDERLAGGFRRGQFIIVAARPGVGKSALATNIARNVALGVPHRSVALFSLEMSRDEIGMRLACAEARISYEKMRHSPSDREWELFTRAAESFQGSAFTVIDTATVTPVDIRARARRIKATRGLDLVIVDYLQLMAPPARGESRQQDVADISRSLKVLAKELDVPVMALSQLNRENEKGKGQKPQLHHLRESGSLEQDPDVVIFITRDDENDPGKVELHVAKHRNGPTGRVTLTFREELMRFENYAPIGQGRMA